MKRRNEIITVITMFLVAGSTLFCSFHDPVSEDYYLDINKIKGGEKPSPPPVISSVTSVPDTETGVNITIDFNGTATIDPDTGSADNLFYLFYITPDDPSLFSDESSYYDYWYLFGYVSHAELVYSGGGTMTTSIIIEHITYHGRLYFWMTAFDDGRETDHSAVVYLDI
jgi:hypothetical protein